MRRRLRLLLHNVIIAAFWPAVLAVGYVVSLWNSLTGFLLVIAVLALLFAWEDA